MFKTCLMIALASGCASRVDLKPTATGAAANSTRSSSSVFVLGGIHQAHEKAKKYSYARLGDVFDHLQPDVLCIEVEQKFLDDGSDKGMPSDFRKFVVPSARKRGVPIVGIDWWDEAKGRQWVQLQQEAYSDPALSAEVALVGGVFQLLNEYFMEKDFQEINSTEITAMWEAKNELKYDVYRRHSAYRHLLDFERERNNHMVENVLHALTQFPDNKRLLVGVGIDHKYYLERELRRRGVRVLTVTEAMTEWWK